MLISFCNRRPGQARVSLWGNNSRRIVVALNQTKMKTPKLLMAGLLAALALQQSSLSEGDPHRRIPIHGEWSVDNPIQFIADVELTARRSYTLFNGTDEVLTVIGVEITWDQISQSYGRTPRGYFVLLPGDTQLFGAPPNLQGEVYSLDFYLWPGGSRLQGKGGVVLREAGPEIAVD